jgi:His/Glu/Gln/Arg/opine family amino acid ABC transporter permease subunit
VIVAGYAPFLLAGFWLTIVLSAVALVAGTVLGFIGGAAATSSLAWLRTLVSVYVEIIRSTPLLIFFFFAFYALPILLGVGVGPVTTASIVLSLSVSAYMTQSVKAGIEAIPAGQWEASKALGFGYLDAMRSVIMPQALRIILPSAIGILVATIKDSSIASVIGVQEATQSALDVRDITLDTWGPLIVIAVMYLIVCTLVSTMGTMLETRLRLRQTRALIRE